MSAPVTATATVALTPEMLAQAFWSLCSDEQAKFFEALHSEIQVTRSDESNRWRWMLGEDGSGQWYHLGKDVEKNDKARSILMAMAAPLYLHALRRIEGAAA